MYLRLELFVAFICAVNLSFLRLLTNELIHSTWGGFWFSFPGASCSHISRFHRSSWCFLWLHLVMHSNNLAIFSTDWPSVIKIIRYCHCFYFANWFFHYRNTKMLLSVCQSDFRTKRMTAPVPLRIQKTSTRLQSESHFRWLPHEGCWETPKGLQVVIKAKHGYFEETKI